MLWAPNDRRWLMGFHKEDWDVFLTSYHFHQMGYVNGYELQAFMSVKFTQNVKLVTIGCRKARHGRRAGTLGQIKGMSLSNVPISYFR